MFKLRIDYPIERHSRIVQRDILCADDLPGECIDDCAGPGSVNGAVAFWRNKLSFKITDREAAIDGLAAYGAWAREELVEETDETLAERALWIACGDFHEDADVFVLGH